MTKRQIAQELNCSFNASGETVVDSNEIDFIQDFLDSFNEETGEQYGDPLYRTEIDRNLWVWKEYDPSHKYLISADVARGDGKDYSTFHILNCTTNHQAAEYRGQPEYDIFAAMLNNTGHK